MSTDLITPVENLFTGTITEEAQKMVEAMDIYALSNNIVMSLPNEEVYSYPSTIPSADAIKTTVMNWAQYLKEKYSNTEITGTYLSNSDLIFNSEMYNTLCNNVQEKYQEYLAKGGTILSDYGEFFFAYIKMVINFDDKNNVAIEQITQAIDNNYSINQDANLLVLSEDGDSNIKASSPALLAAGLTDVSLTVPQNLIDYHTFYKTKKGCTVAICYKNSKIPEKINPTNFKVHRIREVSE